MKTENRWAEMRSKSMDEDELGSLIEISHFVEIGASLQSSAIENCG
jgi:hypothetical protein